MSNDFALTARVRTQFVTVMLRYLSPASISGYHDLRFCTLAPSSKGAERSHATPVTCVSVRGGGINIVRNILVRGWLDNALLFNEVFYKVRLSQTRQPVLYLCILFSLLLRQGELIRHGGHHLR
jgi:hypothetical protein